MTPRRAHLLYGNELSARVSVCEYQQGRSLRYREPSCLHVGHGANDPHYDDDEADAAAAALAPATAAAAYHMLRVCLQARC